MINAKNLDQAIAANLEFIRKQQRPDGSFLSYLPDDAVGHTAVFTTSLIGMALGSTAIKPHARPIIEAISGYLLTQRSPDWSFNYWSKNSAEHKQRPYPDDLDDTFCSLSAIYLNRPDTFEPADFAAIIKMLVSQENSEGGPYRTWLVPKSFDSRWQDVDLAVNCNVAFFLRLNDITLPNLQQFADAAILNQSYTSPYYPPDFPIMYFISRTYSGPYADNLKQAINDKRHHGGLWDNPTDTALAVSALMNLGGPGTDVTAAIEHLMSWKPPQPENRDPFYIEENSRTIGAPALTSSLICEALAKYAASNARGKSSPRRDATGIDIYAAAVKQIRQRYSALDLDIKQEAGLAIDKLLVRDADKQMALLAYHWASGRGLQTTKQSTSAATNLGAVGLYGWLAYSIYDDFLDGTGSPKLLPVANVALRSLEHIMTSMYIDSPNKISYVSSLLDRIESANAWELANCRFDPTHGDISLAAIPDFKDYTRLADRSFGHALGPVSMELLSGAGPADPIIRHIEDFFKHYLIARQLTDDVHDWEQDLEKGHLNVISLNLFAAINPTMRTITLAEAIPAMRQELWHNRINDICMTILEHTGAARRILVDKLNQQAGSPFDRMLTAIDASAKAAKDESLSTRRFLEAYRDDAKD